MTHSDPTPYQSLGYGDVQPHRPWIDRDEEHLRLLSVFHFVAAGFNFLIVVLLVLVPLLWGADYYATLNIQLPPGGMAAMSRRLMEALIAGSLQTQVYALNGWSLRQHQNRISCMVLSVVECLSIPLGLIMGVSAMLVLRRDSVKVLFERNKPQQVVHQ